MKGSPMPPTFYPAVLEAASDGYCVFFPDFDGCTSGGDTANEAAINAAEALALHLEGWTGPLPTPSSLDGPLDPEAEPAIRVLIPTPGAWAPAA